MAKAYGMRPGSIREMGRVFGPLLLLFLMHHVLILLSEEIVSQLLCSCFEFRQDPESLRNEEAKLRLVGPLS